MKGEVSELLKPRYKICPEGYPDMPFKPEAVITLNGFDENHPKGWYYVTQEGQANWYEPYFDRFPNIFIKLPWYAEREAREMPEYLKHGENGKPRKVKRYLFNYNASVEFEGGRTRRLNDDWLPATETEYNQYINKNNEYGKENVLHN